MPGGSVNGRPFKESRHSYAKTGIPCGNPKRYQSQDVVRMGGQQSVQVRDFTGPVEDIETEGQRQLKTLLEKQLSTQTTVKQQLAQSRKFTPGTLYKPTTDEVHGIVDLSDYRVLEETDSRIAELRLCGLTDEEIGLKLQSEDKQERTKRPRLGQEPSYIQDKLTEIDRKIEEHRMRLSRPDTFSGQTTVGRHAMDLEKSLVKDNDQYKRLSAMLLKNQSSDAFPHPEHPMNRIPEILEELTQRSRGDKEKNRKKRKQNVSKNGVNNVDFKHNENQTDQELNDSVNTTEVIGCKTKEDTLLLSLSVLTDEKKCGNIDKKSPIVTSASPSENDEKINLKKPHSKVVGHMVKQISEADIVSGRLSFVEIRKLPKFENYEAGNPNNVLFLKNLSSKVTENDLGSLFLRFQSDSESPLMFRIMSGRMRGQAFVTFKDADTATKALQLLNGYKLHDKPIIIQYGKR